MLVLFKLDKNEDLGKSKSGASVFVRNEVILNLHGIIDVDANKWTVVCLISYELFIESIELGSSHCKLASSLDLEVERQNWRVFFKGTTPAH